MAKIEKILVCIGGPHSGIGLSIGPSVTDMRLHGYTKRTITCGDYQLECLAPETWPDGDVLSQLLRSHQDATRKPPQVASPRDTTGAR
jgi:hypothetical protein